MGSYEQSFAGGAEQGLTPSPGHALFRGSRSVLPELGGYPAPIA